MSVAIRVDVFDSSLTDKSKSFPIMSLLFPTEIITLESLIRERVIKEFNEQVKNGEVKSALIDLKDDEVQLNTQSMDTRVEQHCLHAINAFKRNAFFIVIDDHQEDDLVKHITIHQNSAIEFFKLTPLVGG